VFQRLGLPSPSFIWKWASPSWTFWSGHRALAARLALTGPIASTTRSSGSTRRYAYLDAPRRKDRGGRSDG
jgi:hypothetical protein